ncbi:MAG: xanthine dehydrogenase family protein molybdopterin-binding subunit [Nitrospirae bacterium]|nr:MAG: xanthine dehydrogenase family protein molybdopterin-binding subunit [Nitrospirota bacterium]
MSMGLERWLNSTEAGAESTAEGGVPRRTFLKLSAAAGGGLLLSFILPRIIWNSEATGATTAEVFAPNAFIRIGRDSRVTLIMPYVEMGQGTDTSIPMLIAEELEVDLRQVTLEAAPPDDRQYANPIFQFQVTGASASVRAAWEPLRRAGATARTMLVSAAAQTWNVDMTSCRAEKGEVVHVPSGRRLTYGSLVETVATLPMPDHVALKDPKDFTLIGTSAKRLDAPDKVNGKAQFGIDVKVPGMKIATVAACPVFGGKLANVDDSKAKAIKGVHQVVRLDNAVAVIADHMWAAEQGLAALDIQWDEGPNATVSSADIVQQLESASLGPGVIAYEDGDVAKAMAGAVKKVEAVYQMPFLAYATMEPMNCTVHVRKDGCEVWVGSQVLARAQATAAEVTGLPLDKVQVHNQSLGGGFGRRLEVDVIAQAVQIAKQVNGPVKVVWTREEDIQHDKYRPYYYDRIAAGLDEQGMPIAWSHRISGSSVIARWFPPAFKNGLDPDAVGGEAEEFPYKLPNRLVEYVRQEPPGIPTGFWRGVGPTHNVFVVESFIDELAAVTKKDPLAYRRDLLSKSPRAKAVLELAAEKAGWGQPLPEGQGRGLSVQFVFGSYVAQVAEVEVAKSGEVRVTRVVCAVDCGMVVNPDTVRAQMEGGIMFGLTAALFNEITLKDGRVEQSNFDDYRMLRINEAPAVEVYLVKSAEAPGGIGEPGTTALAPALTNAIFAATGKRIRKLPVNRVELHSA